MRAARGAYAQAIRSQLDAIGIDDLPRNGAFILAGIDAAGGPRSDLPAELGVTKQAVSQLLEILVRRGYLERSPDPDDRRRNVLELTERGTQVVDAVVRAVETVDGELHKRLAAAEVEAMRAGLLALAAIKGENQASGSRRAPAPRQFRGFSPIFSVRDLASALAHYASLGFSAFAYEDGDEYGFANRDGVSLHVAADPAHDTARGASAYLYVRDADALYEQWSRPGIGGSTHPVAATPYGLREGAHVDPDGNLIRFGSPIGE
jgi:DNA-binding MarR family transcriptional regulator/catechol 2,3-dioxygenase-like lactoylglutathione lyase family enzyme